MLEGSCDRSQSFRIYILLYIFITLDRIVLQVPEESLIHMLSLGPLAGSSRTAATHLVWITVRATSRATFLLHIHKDDGSKKYIQVQVHSLWGTGELREQRSHSLASRPSSLSRETFMTLPHQAACSGTNSKG